MAAMYERITELEQAARPGFDIRSLRREHQDRSTWLERRMASRPEEIDWDTVRAGAAELLSR